MIRRLVVSAAILCTVAASARPALALTLSDIETQVRRNVRDTGTNTALYRYSDTVLDAMINEAQREVVNMTWAVEASTGYVLTAATTFYSLPTNMLAINQVTFRTAAGVTSKLEGLSESKVVTENPDYARNQTGPPIQYFVRHSTQAADPLEISYLPVPTTSSTGTVTIDYYAQATDLSSDSDEPFEGYDHLAAYHSTLVFYVTARIKLLEGYTAEASAYLSLYNSMLQIMQDKLNRMPDYELNLKGATGVGR